MSAEQFEEIVVHYQTRYSEQGRLNNGAGLLERLRTMEIVSRDLRSGVNFRIADVGGGPGAYAGWLANLGHDVELVDPVALHVEQASSTMITAGSLRAHVGDARQLPFDDETFDMVLMLGPLYHLVEKRDRLVAINEARRIAKPGGVIIAAAISRFASVHDGLVSGYLLDAEFAEIVKTALASGRHVNPTNRPGWFTTAYFHSPNELVEEFRQCGITDATAFGVEGLAGWLPDLDDRLANPQQRMMLLDAVRSIEQEPTLLGVSSHLLVRGTNLTA
jgi:ubiquinone/menaquinone biosynthesis C-methylase UbiE